MGFQDHFSNVATSYSQVRPRYPDALFAELAQRSPSRRLAWDCGTGNGQAALSVALHFEHVIATDPSAAQIANATPHPRIEYRVGSAEHSGLGDSSIDLITVAQAAHWFEFEAFHREVRRVLVPRGVIACFTYSDVSIDPVVDAALARLVQNQIGEYWPPERRFVDDLYRTLPFPFPEFEFPQFWIEEPMTRERFAGYLASWSATQRFVKARGFDPIAPFIESLARHWPADETRTARWRMGIRVGFNS